MGKTNLVLIHMVDAVEPEFTEEVEQRIRFQTDTDFEMISFPVSHWNDDLSPWPSPAVFGKDDFGGHAEATLERLLPICNDTSKTYILGGYSLAGLFALWAGCRTDCFTGIAAASPSVWFPGFMEDMKEHPMKAESVYLSLGNREGKTKNPTMSRVEFCISNVFDMLQKQQINTILVWNEGNHFKDVALRTANAFAWCVNALQ
ncbi:MAG: esterase [Lachnospiraceae bacterium]|jgi:predicted alpha/beta superfamily hydrolase|nr:esterase [Lachnospiraceae bacterium]